jgi:hypothetical protein
MSEEGLVYAEGERVTYRASGLGGCEKALVAARLNYDASPPPQKLLEVFEAGHKAEAEFYAKHDTHYTGYQEVVQIEVAPGVYVRGHIDGLVKTPPTWPRIVSEIKSQSDDEFKKWKPAAFVTSPLWKKYTWQFSVYMWAAGNPQGGPAKLELARVNRETGDSEIHVYSVPWHDLDEIRQRVLRIEALAELELLPSCDEEGEWGCPYWKQFHRGEEKEWVVEEDDELDEAAALHKMLQGEEKEAAKRVADSRKRIIKILGERVDIHTTGGYDVKVLEIETKEHMVKGSKSTRLVIERRKGHDDGRRVVEEDG